MLLHWDNRSWQITFRLSDSSLNAEDLCHSVMLDGVRQAKLPHKDVKNHEATPQIVGFIPVRQDTLLKQATSRRTRFLKHFRPLQTLLSTEPQALEL